jgi:hypothetical protein
MQDIVSIGGPPIVAGASESRISKQAKKNWKGGKLPKFGHVSSWPYCQKVKKPKKTSKESGLIFAYISMCL